MDEKRDIVLLDGRGHSSRWPIELAEELLADPATWGADIRNYFGSSLLSQEERDQAAKTPTRYSDAYHLAIMVNGYNRHQVDWASQLFREIGAGGPCERYSTQELLDAVFIACRQERFNDGLVASLEPQLRLMVAEVVRRVRSSTPPVFISVQSSK